MVKKRNEGNRGSAKGGERGGLPLRFWLHLSRPKFLNEKAEKLTTAITCPALNARLATPCLNQHSAACAAYAICVDH